jgi:hypothetical protein
LGCDAVLTGRYLPTVRRKLLPSSSGWKSENWLSRFDNSEDFCLLGYGPVQSGRYLPEFRRNCCLHLRCRRVRVWVLIAVTMKIPVSLDMSQFSPVYTPTFRRKFLPPSSVQNIEVLILMTMAIFCNVTQFSLVDIYQRFGGGRCLRLHLEHWDLNSPLWWLWRLMSSEVWRAVVW